MNPKSETTLIGEKELKAAIDAANLASIWKTGRGTFTIPKEEALGVFAQNPFLYPLVVHSLEITGLPIIKNDRRYILRLIEQDGKIIPFVGTALWGTPVPEFSNLEDFDEVTIAFMPDVDPTKSPDRRIILSQAVNADDSDDVFTAQLDNDRLELVLQTWLETNK